MYAHSFKVWKAFILISQENDENKAFEYQKAICSNALHYLSNDLVEEGEIFICDRGYFPLQTH